MPWQNVLLPCPTVHRPATDSPPSVALDAWQLRSQHEARQEAMQRRKMDKAQREKEEYETLTKEQKLRRDIRDEKKKEKLRQKKMFRMKVRRA